MKPRIRGRDPLVAGVVLAALAIRTLYALRPHVCFGDESCYLWLAKNLFGGAGYTYYDSRPELHFPPLFPISLGLLNLVVRDWEAVSRAAYVLFGGLLPIPVFLLGRAMYSRRAGLIAASITAIFPAFTSGVLFAETMSEPLYLLCLYTGISLAWKAWTARSWSRAVLAGAALSLANLTRPEGLLYAGSTFFFLAAGPLAAAGEPLARRLAGTVKLALPLAAAFLLVASPYAAYLHARTGSWSLSTKGATTYLATRGLVHHDGVAFQRDTWGLNEKGEVNYFAQDFSRGCLELLLGPYRHRVLSDVSANLSNMESVLLRPWVLGGVLVLFAFLGLVGAPWAPGRLAPETLNLLVIAPTSSVLLFFVNERFLYGMLLPCILWSALGVEHLLGWISSTHLPGRLGAERARKALQVLLLSALAAYLLRAGYRHFQRQAGVEREVLDAASWLRKNTPEGAVVMATGPEVSFHAGRGWLPVPVASREKVVAYGRARKATHLCIRGRYLSNRPEQKAELFDGARSFEDLELLVRADGGAGGPSFVVYRLEQAGERGK